jgi:hypothetical protein
MTQRADLQFAIRKWDETPYDELDGGPKLTRARVEKTWSGPLEATSTVEFLMMYRADGSAAFTGLERLHGTFGGRAGSFVAQHDGRFEGGVARGTWTVVPGSGTGALRGLRGRASFEHGHTPPHGFAFDYDFE